MKESTPGAVVGESLGAALGRAGHQAIAFQAAQGEPAKQSRKPAKLGLTLEPGVQPTIGDRGGRITAIKRMCLVDDGVIGLIALGGGLRACDLRSCEPDWCDFQ